MLQPSAHLPAEQALLAHAMRRQLTVSFWFAGIGVGMFFAYVLLNAFGAHLLSARIAPGASITVAIALGYLMILSTMALAGIYVFVNHRYVAPEIERLRRMHDV